MTPGDSSPFLIYLIAGRDVGYDGVNTMLCDQIMMKHSWLKKGTILNGSDPF